jgi:hypothetical protein
MHVSCTNTCGGRSHMSKTIASLHMTQQKWSQTSQQSQIYQVLMNSNSETQQFLHRYSQMVLTTYIFVAHPPPQKREHLHKKNLLSYMACRNKPKIQSKKHTQHMHVYGMKPSTDILESLKKLGPLQTETSQWVRIHTPFCNSTMKLTPPLWPTSHKFSIFFRIYFHYQTTFEAPLSFVILTHCWRQILGVFIIL